MAEYEDALREVQRMLRAVAVDTGDVTAEATLMWYALKLPLGSVVKVRESVQRSRKRIGVGYAAAALKSELGERGIA